ncbi:MAG TPA: hypothetical protein ENG92_02515 [Thiolapillus brandeum]|uniref:Sulfotransferase family protein n=1 Tax=Thiolapillus brandeum TaxID=1076588 RepID=A0A831KCI7_9GAMM|nr:hypothetical protein [Thiolapillus brandeum]
MNIFVLNTGRCGSTTFIRACRYISNYSAGHESNIHRIGEQRLSYSDNHIEADNRLSWMLGRVDRRYGDNAYYVHLHRERESAARSFARRMEFGIMKAYREGVLLGGQERQSAYEIALDYIDTVEANINHFLKDKHYKMDFSLEQADTEFLRFWENIGAEGNLNAALDEWKINHNASG